jgi:ABC-type sulfate/molybdate transport systems ATPase subunit
LLLDEPFSQVDVLMRKQLRADLKRLSKELGTTMVLVSHDPLDGLSLADTLLVLKQGELLQKGTPTELIDKPANAYVAKLLGAANVLAAQDASHILGLELTSNQVLVSYPHELVIVDEGIQAQILDVRYQLHVMELEIKVADTILTIMAPLGNYAVGALIHIAFQTYRVTSAE